MIFFQSHIISAWCKKMIHPDIFDAPVALLASFTVVSFCRHVFMLGSFHFLCLHVFRSLLWKVETTFNSFQLSSPKLTANALKIGLSTQKESLLPFTPFFSGAMAMLVLGSVFSVAATLTSPRFLQVPSGLIKRGVRIPLGLTMSPQNHEK